MTKIYQVEFCAYVISTYDGHQTIKVELEDEDYLEGDDGWDYFGDGVYTHNSDDIEKAKAAIVKRMEMHIKLYNKFADKFNLNKICVEIKNED